MTTGRLARLACRAALASAVVVAVAAAAPSARADEDRARAERVERRRGEILRREVGLDDRRAAEVEKVLKKRAPERQKARKEQRRALRDLAELLEDDSGDQQAYTKALERVKAARAKLRSLADQEIAELEKLLTPKQQAKLLRALQRHRRDARRDRRRQHRGDD
ncbi:MAG: periplasmic heavy metal sensor [Polyangiaceae bacterium]|nr:periplasmic heavy metal sensor [Polyangiaceae bacterium]